MRKDAHIPGICLAALIALGATVGVFLAREGREIGWLCVFAASLVLFFSSLPADHRASERE